MASVVNVGLVDVDSKIPNLALMKISTWHKQCGDSVKMYEPIFDNPDLVYASKIFDFTPDYEYFPACQIIKGGTGYDLTAKLDLPNYDRIMPDYSLYNCKMAIGRFTRGCPNNCPWCVVPKMDGNKVIQVADLTDFWSGQRVVRLLDDNIMADEDVFCQACEQLSKAGVRTIWEALDIRRVNNRTAKSLAMVKQDKRLHFAWDTHYDQAVIDGIECLNRNGIKPWRLMFYVLVGAGTSREYDMYRIETLRQLGANPFVMPFDKGDKYQRDLARWCNHKAIFKTCSFQEYAKV